MIIEYEKSQVHKCICNLITECYNSLDTYQHDWKNSTHEERARDWKRFQERVRIRVRIYESLLAKWNRIDEIELPIPLSGEMRQINIEDLLKD